MNQTDRDVITLFVVLGICMLGFLASNFIAKMLITAFPSLGQ